MTRRLLALLGDPRLVWVAVACAFALRLWYGLRFFPRELAGDEVWYVETATLLVRDGLGAAGPEFYIRPPGTTLVFAAIFWLFGAGNAPAIVIANAMLTSASVWLVAALARAVLPRVAWAPVVLAWVQVAHPWDLGYSGRLLSECITMPLTLLYVLVCVRSTDPPTWRRILLVGAVGALLVHVRIDCLPLVIAAPAWSLLSRWRRGLLKSAGLAARGLAPAVWRWAAAAGLALVLCVPWSMHVSGRVGQTSFLYSSVGNQWAKSNTGWLMWMSGVSMRQNDWVPLVWFPYWVGARTLPADAFDTPEEEVEVRGLLERAREEGELSSAARERFLELGAARRDRDPLRFYVWLPIERSARMWLDVTDRDYNFRGEAPPYSTVQKLSRAWRYVFSVLAGLGFLTCFVFVFRLRSPASVVAIVVLVRTFSFAFAGPVLNGAATFEGRYICNADSLALVVLAAAAAAAIERLGGDRGSPLHSG